MKYLNYAERPMYFGNITCSDDTIQIRREKNHRKNSMLFSDIQKHMKKR